jgi:DNA-binding winged helix-turn-helix (wHTH) protein
MAEFTFVPFVLRTHPRRLTRDGAEVRPRPRAFQTLQVLLQHQGDLVDHGTMLAEAWEGTHVSRHTVDVTVSEVRRQLGEYGRWVVQRPKYGYALEVPMSDDLVRQGWHFLGQRTRTGCERAIDCFKRAIGECPSDFRAYEGCRHPFWRWRSSASAPRCRVPGSAQKKVIERFALSDDGKSVLYSGTVDDPLYLSAPGQWSGRLEYRPGMPHSNQKCDVEIARGFLKD